VVFCPVQSLALWRTEGGLSITEVQGVGVLCQSDEVLEEMDGRNGRLVAARAGE